MEFHQYILSDHLHYYIFQYYKSPTNNLADKNITLKGTLAGDGAVPCALNNNSPLLLGADFVVYSVSPNEIPERVPQLDFYYF